LDTKSETRQRADSKNRKEQPEKSVEELKELEDLKKAEFEIRKDRVAFKNQQSKTLPLTRNRQSSTSSTHSIGTSSTPPPVHKRTSSNIIIPAGKKVTTS